MLFSNHSFETMLVLLTTPGTECSKCGDAAPRKEWETNSTASAAGMNLADEDGIFTNSVSSVERNIVDNDLVPTAKQDTAKYKKRNTSSSKSLSRTRTKSIPVPSTRNIVPSQHRQTRGNTVIPTPV